MYTQIPHGLKNLMFKYKAITWLIAICYEDMKPYKFKDKVVFTNHKSGEVQSETLHLNDNISYIFLFSIDIFISLNTFYNP